MLKDVLKEARNNRLLKQEDVAKAINVTKQTYLKWENGVTEPKASQIVELAKVLGITPNEICGGYLNERLPLERFIMEIHKSQVSSEMETLKMWEHITDHKLFIHALNHPAESDLGFEAYTHDLKEEMAFTDPKDL